MLPDVLAHDCEAARAQASAIFIQRTHQSVSGGADMRGGRVRRRIRSSFANAFQNVAMLRPSLFAGDFGQHL